MEHKNLEEEEDTLAAIGIGAMIVFIALILVAAVAAAVIIQTAEKLQQNAQKTGDDTAKQSTSVRKSKRIFKSYVFNRKVSCYSLRGKLSSFIN